MTLSATKLGSVGICNDVPGMGVGSVTAEEGGAGVGAAAAAAGRRDGARRTGLGVVTTSSGSWVCASTPLVAPSPVAMALISPTAQALVRESFDAAPMAPNM